jgi:uncharacterized protein
MGTVKQVLEGLLAIPGVGTAVVVSRDGFVIEGNSSSGSLDMEAVGAVVSAGVGASEVIGSELGVGGLAHSIVEYDKGIIVASPVGSAATLAVVADLKANLGNVRYQVRKNAPAIGQVL